jgi:hypothetical protein
MPDSTKTTGGKGSPARVAAADFACESLPILVRRITAYTTKGAEIWGEPIAAFRYPRDAERFVASTQYPDKHVIEKNQRRVIGRDGHGYAILEALSK